MKSPVSEPRTKSAARSVFFRYILTNLLILLPPIIVAIAFFFVASDALSRAADAIAEVQLESSVSFIDRTLSDLDKIVTQLVVDYRVNHYLNITGEFDPLDLYDMDHITDKLSTIVLTGEFLSRCMLYLGATDYMIYESGFARFAGFYGPLLRVAGHDADSWRELMLGGETGVLGEYSGFQASTGGRYRPAHFLIRPIGYRYHHRGAFIAMIDAGELGRRLSRLPDLYGGVMLVFNPQGTLLASSPPDPRQELIDAAAAAQPGTIVTLGEERYRMYRETSSFNGWSYVAIMSENRITASARWVRDTAFLLLVAGFFIAVLLSYGLASSNSRPIARLFSLVLPEQETKGGGASSAYARVEEAILSLADSKTRLEREVDSVHGIARTYFFHTLLRGEYRERALFEEDRSRFSVLVSHGFYYVIEGRLPSLAAALDGQDRLALGEALRRAFAAGLAADEHAVIINSGVAAAIKRSARKASYMEEAARYVHGVSEALDSAVRDGLVFGVSTPVEDPFLLPLCYGEAEVAAENTGQGNTVRFYETLPAPMDVYRYPLETESAVIKAVISANTVLLESLIKAIHDENFIERTLPSQEARYLTAALRGTALRLIVDSHASEILKELGTSASPPLEDFRAIAQILFSLAEERRRGKRSHNEALAVEVTKHVNERFRDFNLSLASIAEVFNLSENYLSSFFKEQSGECLSEYIQRKRMTEAAILLNESRKSVDAIASDCGYANVASFRRAFKRVYGLSPSDYRNRNGSP